MLYSYGDLVFDPKANETVADFVRIKIREIVHDPKVAEKLTPSHYYCAKRPILDTNYFETFNRDNVSLADVKSPMADLPVLEVISASHIVTDLTLSKPDVIYDYLAEQ